MTVRWLWHVVLPLTTGAFIYLVFADTDIRLVNFLKNHTASAAVTNFRRYLQTQFSPPDFVLYNLPDALWAYAYCAALLLLRALKQAAFTAGFAFLFCCSYEFGQYFGFLKGTFDWSDVIIMAAACGTAYFILRKTS